MERRRPDLLAAIPLMAPAPVQPASVTPWWRNRRLIPWLVQAAAGLVLLVVIAFLVGNLVRNLTASACNPVTGG